MIFLNQPLEIFSFCKESGVRVNLTDATSKYLYWKPSNTSDIPDGEVPAVIIDEEEGSVQYQALENFLDESGDWVFRPIAEFGNGDVPSDEGTIITVSNIERIQS